MYWNVNFVFLSIITLTCSAAVEGNDDFCRNHKDLVSLPTDYNSLLEPKPNVVVNNDIKLLNIIKVTFESLMLPDEIMQSTLHCLKKSFYSIFIQIDDIQQTFTIVIDQMIGWDDARLIVNKNNSYWKANKSHALLSANFVEECLWTPKMMFVNANEKEVSSSSNIKQNSKLKYFLIKNGSVVLYRRSSKLTFSCGMDFSSFPFDIQVH